MINCSLILYGSFQADLKSNNNKRKGRVWSFLYKFKRLTSFYRAGCGTSF